MPELSFEVAQGNHTTKTIINKNYLDTSDEPDLEFNVSNMHTPLEAGVLLRPSMDIHEVKLSRNVPPSIHYGGLLRGLSTSEAYFGGLLKHLAYSAGLHRRVS